MLVLSRTAGQSIVIPGDAIAAFKGWEDDGIEIVLVAIEGHKVGLGIDAPDAVTISFGLRNVPDPEAALAEFARVTRPGGRVVVCEFADPTWRPFREVYRRYLVGALPRMARVVSSSASAYQYLADSILAWPDRRTLAGWIDAAGYDQVRVRDLSGGIVAVHRGVRR